MSTKSLPEIVNVTLGMLGILSQSTTAWLEARKDRVSQMVSRFSSISSWVSWLAIATCKAALALIDRSHTVKRVLASVFKIRNVC